MYVCVSQSANVATPCRRSFQDGLQLIVEDTYCLRGAKLADQDPHSEPVRRREQPPHHKVCVEVFTYLPGFFCRP